MLRSLLSLQSRQQQLQQLQHRSLNNASSLLSSSHLFRTLSSSSSSRWKSSALPEDSSPATQQQQPSLSSSFETNKNNGHISSANSESASPPQGNTSRSTDTKRDQSSSSSLSSWRKVKQLNDDVNNKGNDGINHFNRSSRGSGRGGGGERQKQQNVNPRQRQHHQQQHHHQHQHNNDNPSFHRGGGDDNNGGRLQSLRHNLLERNSNNNSSNNSSNNESLESLATPLVNENTIERRRFDDGRQHRQYKDRHHQHYQQQQHYRQKQQQQQRTPQNKQGHDNMNKQQQQQNNNSGSFTTTTTSTTPRPRKSFRHHNQRHPRNYNNYNKHHNNKDVTQSFLQSVHRERSKTKQQYGEDDDDDDDTINNILDKTKPLWRRLASSSSTTTTSGMEPHRFRHYDDEVLQQHQQQRHRRRQQQILRQQQQHQSSSPPPSPKKSSTTTTTATIQLPSSSTPLTLRNLSSLLRVKRSTLQNTLPHLSLDDIVDEETLELVAMEYDITIVPHAAAAQEVPEMTDDDVTLYPRPPVVSLMGHVDHGKTTLLDALRSRSSSSSSSTTPPTPKKAAKTSKFNKNNNANNNAVIAGTEAGGITQIISAFQIPLPPSSSSSPDDDDDDDDTISTITILDTPGHAAFQHMRHSGGKTTDVLILVISAIDGVREQTIEILEMFLANTKEKKTVTSAAAGSSSMGLVVAVTKVDRLESKEERENAIHRIGNELAMRGLDMDDVIMCPVSGVTGEGVEELLDGVVLTSQMMELKSHRRGGEGEDVSLRSRRMEGVVLEGRVEKGRGVMVDVVVREGGVRVGDCVLGLESGCVGRVRSLLDVNGKSIKSAEPSQPVQILGIKSLPQAGETIITIPDEDSAEDFLSTITPPGDDDTATMPLTTMEHQVTGFSARQKSDITTTTSPTSTTTTTTTTTPTTIIPIIIKADADGTLRALQTLLQSLPTTSTTPLQIQILSTSSTTTNTSSSSPLIGPPTTSDLLLARESNAFIAAFNVKCPPSIKNAMMDQGIKYCESKIIYRLLDQMKEVIDTCYLPPRRVESVVGVGLVREVFELGGGLGVVAGVRVMEGMMVKQQGEKEEEVYVRVKRGSTATTTTKGGDNKGIVVVEGEKVKSLKRVKEDVDGVKMGEECGLGLVDFGGFEKGDVVECYKVTFEKNFV